MEAKSCVFSETTLLIPQPAPYLAVKMRGLGLSIALLMVILCAVRNSLPFLHPFLLCLFKHRQIPLLAKSHTRTLLCGMLHPDLTIVCHYCRCNGISGESCRGWIYCFAVILVADNDTAALMSWDLTLLLPQVGLELSSPLPPPVAPCCLPKPVHLAVSRLNAPVACPHFLLCGSRLLLRAENCWALACSSYLWGVRASVCPLPPGASAGLCACFMGQRLLKTSLPLGTPTLWPV